MNLDFKRDMEFIGGSFNLKDIFTKNSSWDKFWLKNAPHMRWDIIWNVQKTIMCRDKWGYDLYTCAHCPDSYRKVPHTCKSRFCSSCGKIAADRWAEKSLNELLDVEYKHLFFTMPKELRSWFAFNRKEALNCLFTAVKDAILKFAHFRGFKPGIIQISHTFGARLNWNPHIHILLTAGGLCLKEESWKTGFYNCIVIKKFYRYNLLKSLAKLFKENKLTVPEQHKHIKTPYTFQSYLTQFHHKEWYVKFGRSLNEKKSNRALTYIARYTKRPVIAESKITNATDTHVTFEFDDRATGEKKTLALPIEVFFKRLIRHIPDFHFRVIRHVGIFANRVRTKALEKARSFLGQKIKQIKKVTWREKYKLTYGKDPLHCKICGLEMQLTEIKDVKTNVIKADLLEQHAKKKKKYHGQMFTGFT